MLRDMSYQHPHSAEKAPKGKPWHHAVFMGLYMAAVIGPLGLFALSSAHEWNQLESRSSSIVSMSRDTIAEHAKRVFRTHAVVARLVDERVRLMTWPEIEADAELHRLLADTTAEFRELTHISLIDEDGTLRAASSSFPANPIDLRDRDYFIMALQGQESGVGHRIIGRMTGRDVIPLSFRRHTSAGGFTGVVGMGISATVFEEAYRDMAAFGTPGLMHEDGTILALPSDHHGTLPPPGAMSALVTQGAGREVTTLEDPGSDRIFRIGVARIDNWPIYAFHVLDDTDMASFRQARLLANGPYYFAAILALLGLVTLAWRVQCDANSLVLSRTSELSRSSGLLADALREREVALEQRAGALKDREMLLREVHHRVKNNMQIIASMIRLQDRNNSTPEATLHRVMAMSLVHEMIYAGATEISQIDLVQYVDKLRGSLAEAFPGIRFESLVEPVRLDLERAIPFALIANEAISNAARHAYPDGKGEVRIGVARDGGDVVLSVCDDGTCYDPSASQGRGFGLKLIKSLCVQLAGRHGITCDGGTRFELRFPEVAPPKPGAPS